jgi:hypothetical protein
MKQLLTAAAAVWVVICLWLPLGRFIAAQQGDWSLPKLLTAVAIGALSVGSFVVMTARKN